MNLAIILSGGTGSRFGGELPKQYLSVVGKPIIVHTAQQFQMCGGVDVVAIAAETEWHSQIWEWARTFRLTKLRVIAPAGIDRQHSIRNGLEVCAEFMQKGGQDGVIIQDAARPLTSVGLLDRLIAGLKEAPCVLPAVSIPDTVYTSEGGSWVEGLLDRSSVYAGQAPEAFHYWEYYRLYAGTEQKQLSAMSGSCQLPYQAGWKVKIIPGERENFKITYPTDLKLCELILKEREEAK